MDIEKRTRELFADWHRQHGCAGQIIDDCLSGIIQMPELSAQLVAMAFTPPYGYVMVPVICTDAMEGAAYRAAGSPTDGWYGFEDMWKAAIAARPEVP